MTLRRQRFVLDTSAFTAPRGSAKQIAKHIEKMVKLISKAKDANISCYVPPSVWEELKGMLERKKIPKKLIEKLDAWTIQKAPSITELQIPAAFAYQYVEEIRDRFNKGLREAEKAVLKTKHGLESHEQIIKELRDKYRVAIKQGILDSKEDIDVIFLAKELKAGIAAKDEGIKKFAKRWGIRFIDAEAFPNLIQEYLEKI